MATTTGWHEGTDMVDLQLPHLQHRRRDTHRFELPQETIAALKVTTKHT